MTPTRLFDFAHNQLESAPQKIMFSGKNQSGKVTQYSTKEFIEIANQLSLGLIGLGVKPGDKISIISHNNRPEWNVVDQAVLQIGAIDVPVYPTIAPKDYVYIFNDSEVKFCFVGDGDLLKKVREAQPQVPSLKEIFTFDEVEGAHHWFGAMQEGDYTPVKERMAAIKETDLATLIYTSGTTGNPKGVMLSHKNIVSNVFMVKDIVPSVAGDVVFSFLPLCHIFERTCSYVYMFKACSVFYAQSMETLRDELPVVKPTFFTTVPRLLEKVYERVYTLSTKDGGLKKKIFLWAHDLTLQYDQNYKPTGLDAVKWTIADKLVFSKIRARLGGNLKGIATGAAACPRKMAQFFSAAGMPVREAYGLTETSPGLTGNRFKSGHWMLGTVGSVFTGVDVKIDETGEYGPGEGEILAKGDNIMMGYYNKPEATAEVIDKDGWFHTGDVGKFVENELGIKFLKITDRKKELLKTSNGKYIAPSPIESRFKEEFLIEQMMVLGDNQKFAAGIVTLSLDATKGFFQDRGIAFTSLAEAAKHPAILREMQAICDKLNPNFAHVEQIKKFIVVPDAWDVASGELTPTMKLKRRVIMDKYAKEIAEIYA